MRDIKTNKIEIIFRKFNFAKGEALQNLSIFR